MKRMNWYLLACFFGFHCMKMTDHDYDRTYTHECKYCKYMEIWTPYNGGIKIEEKDGRTREINE